MGVPTTPYMTAGGLCKGVADPRVRINPRRGWGTFAVAAKGRRGATAGDHGR